MFTSRYKETIRRWLPKKLKKHRIIRGPLKGQLIYTSWHDYPGAILGTTELPLLDWFSTHAKRDQTWLDIGAHYGYTAIALAKLVGEKGRVLAFEPVLATAACVSRTRILNHLMQLQTVPIGLSTLPRIETRRLAIVRGMADSTLSQETWLEVILVCGFDHLWQALCEGEPAVHGIKIDVQGMELEVLRGMQETLKQQRPKLVVEFHEGVDRGQVLRLLAECGYRDPGRAVDTKEETPSYADNRSYAFLPSQQP